MLPIVNCQLIFALPDEASDGLWAAAKLGQLDQLVIAFSTSCCVMM